jgi:acyl carrier protein
VTKEEFLLALDEMLELPPGTLKGPEKIEDIETWDSLAVINLMALVDEHYSVKLAPRQIGAAETVDQLYALTSK